MDELFGGIEIGGTKTIFGVGYANGQLLAHNTVPTTSVEETLNAMYEFFDGQPSISAMGVGSFGPFDINKHSVNYGQIYNAPKPGWANVKLKELISSRFNVPMVFDLDVNFAAIGELNFGVAKDADSLVYLTLGTGIGGSLIINKQIVHGILNLEMGHMRIPHEPFTDRFSGACEYHGDCLEGLASGYAIQQHYGRKAQEIDSQEVWDLEAEYIALALNNIIMTIGPEKIVLGGGLSHHAGLIEQVRSKLSPIVNDYLPLPSLDDYIVKSSGDLNAALGAIKLAST